MDEWMKFICPVCGYNMAPYPPKEYNICPRCGTEFENADQTATYAELRQKWVDGGKQFFFPKDAKPSYRRTGGG
jgi:anaerobic ribonucleoside-triphosphate reductase